MDFLKKGSVWLLLIGGLDRYLALPGKMVDMVVFIISGGNFGPSSRRADDELC